MITFPQHQGCQDNSYSWLGDIPKSWQIIRAKYVLREVDERSQTGCEELLSVSHLTGVTLRSEKNVNMFLSEDYSGSKLCQPNDLVINTMWAWMGALGVSPIKGIVSPAYGVYRPYGNVYPRFLDSLLRTPQYIAEYIRRSTGIHSSRLRLYPNQFLDIPLLLPPLEEQKRIVEFLDRKTAEIDEAIAHKQRLIKLLQEHKSILINQAVTKGLNPNVPMRDSGFSWIGKVPSHWYVVPIKRVIEVRDGTHETPAYVDPGDNTFPLITSKDFEEKHINFETAKHISAADYKEVSKRSSVQKGDVLMSVIGGNIGKSLIVNTDRAFSLKNAAFFKTASNSDLAKFTYYYLTSGLLQHQISLKGRGGAQGFLSLTDVRNLVFFKIPKNEVEQIASYLDIETQKYESLIALAKIEISRIQGFRRILIANAITGKIQV